MLLSATKRPLDQHGMTARVREAALGRVKYHSPEIAGVATGILTAGPPDAVPVILLHGFSGDALTWQE